MRVLVACEYTGVSGTPSGRGATTPCRATSCRPRSPDRTSSGTPRGPRGRQGPAGRAPALHLPRQQRRPAAVPGGGERHRQRPLGPDGQGRPSSSPCSGRRSHGRGREPGHARARRGAHRRPGADAVHPPVAVRPRRAEVHRPVAPGPAAAVPTDVVEGREAAGAGGAAGGRPLAERSRHLSGHRRGHGRSSGAAQLETWTIARSLRSCGRMITVLAGSQVG